MFGYLPGSIGVRMLSLHSERYNIHDYTGAVLEMANIFAGRGTYVHWMPYLRKLFLFNYLTHLRERYSLYSAVAICCVSSVVTLFCGVYLTLFWGGGLPESCITRLFVHYKLSYNARINTRASLLCRAV